MNLIVFYLKFKFPALLDEFIVQATSFLESILNVFQTISFQKSKCFRGIRTTPESMKCVYISGTESTFSFAAFLISPSVSRGVPSPMRGVGSPQLHACADIHLSQPRSGQLVSREARSSAGTPPFLPGALGTKTRKIEPGKTGPHTPSLKV